MIIKYGTCVSVSVGDGGGGAGGVFYHIQIPRIRNIMTKLCLTCRYINDIAIFHLHQYTVFTFLS